MNAALDGEDSRWLICPRPGSQPPDRGHHHPAAISYVDSGPERRDPMI